MQVQTERGLIFVEGAYQSAEHCMMDGYGYSFTAHNVYLPDIGRTVASIDLYSKCLDSRGLRRTFVYVL